MTSGAAQPSRARVRVAVPRLVEGECALGSREARYLARVHRLRSGDAFVAFDPERGLEADGEVLEVTAAGLIARLDSPRAARLVAAREVTWLQALPKGEKMDGIVRDATELGATRIVPVTTAFTVVKLDGPRRDARHRRWERIAREAARQCGRSDVPVITPVSPWAEALAVARPSDEMAFCLYERATTSLGAMLVGAAESSLAVAFAAGPEGGLSAEEVDVAGLHGFTAVSLGAFVLRAETVAAATLGALRVLEGAGTKVLR